MTKDNALKMAQDACPYTNEELRGAFYDGFIKALDQLTDTTKMIDTGTDRGAWDDVPDATKWVDELRGDEDLEEPPNSTTDFVEPEIVAVIGNWGRVEWREGVFPQIGDRMYSAPPKRKWVGLTDEEIVEVGKLTTEGERMLPHSFARAIEAKLKEKNNG